MNRLITYPFWFTLSGLLLFGIKYSGAQIVLKDTSWIITQAQDSGHLFMGGFTDPENTWYIGENYQAASGFESMRYLRITNLDTLPSWGAKFLLNRRGNWYSRQEMAAEALQNAQTDKEKALNLFEFVRKSRVHYSSAEYGHLDETHEPVKVMGVYGYGLCDDAAFAITNLAHTAGIPAIEWGITAHNISEIVFNDPAILDADLEVFYPDYDNSTLKGKYDLSDDRYLVSRVLHHGRNIPFDLNFNRHVASMYTTFDGVIHRNPNPHELYFTLLPEQSVTFSWERPDSLFEHRNWEGITTPQMFSRLIGNAFWDLTINPFNPGFTRQLETAQNIKTDTTGLGLRMVPWNAQHPMVLVHKASLPFPHLDHKVFFQTTLPDLSDSLLIDWSVDSLNWNTVYSQTGPFNGFDSCSLYQQIQPLVNNAIYAGYIRIRLYQADSLVQAGLDSLRFQSRTQNSKFFLPYLTIGQNHFHFSRKDSLNGLHQIEMGWQEEHSNHPPTISNVPVFPGIGITTDTARILFRWGNAQDPDGNYASKYHFQLSDRPDMAHCLASNFDRIINPISPSLMAYPSFKPEVTGFLNHGQTYYWRVRAMDSQGLWGPWTNTWSFTVNCVMAPTLGSLSLTDSNYVVSWNPGSPGNTPLAYAVHGSNEMSGFIPTEQTLLGITNNTFWVFDYHPNPPPTFLRIVALDGNGEESQPSQVINTPFPFVFTNTNPIVKPDTTFKVQLQGNYRYYSYYYYFYPDTMHQQSWVSPIQFPNFLTWNPTLSEFTANPDSATIRRMLYDSSLRNISFQVIAPYSVPVTQSLHLIPSLENRKPLLDSYFPSSTGLGNYIQDTVHLLDRDADFGDTHSWQILQVPAWISTQTTDEYIVLSGTPGYAAIADTLLTLIVQDSYGLEDTLFYSYHFPMFNNPPLFLSVPDTLVDPNLMYEYSISVYDPDTVLGDSVQLSIQQGPFWVYLNTVNQKLQGYPIVAQGADSLIRIRATDLAGAWVEQDFVLHFKRRTEMDSIDSSGTGIPDELIGDWNEAEGYGISVFPNPTQDVTQVRLRLPANGTIQVQLYTAEGKYHSEIVAGFREAGIRQVLFNSECLAPGAYWIRFRYNTDNGEEYQYTQKLIVLH